MISSMTGYASATRETAIGNIAVELKTVNHRYLEFQTRMPEELRPLEPALRETGTEVAVLGSIPIDVRLREGGDNGTPLVLADPDAPAAKELRTIAERLSSRARGLAGRQLGLSTVRHS